MEKTKHCYKCKTVWEGVTQPARTETCPKCNADLYVCLNCRFYDTGKPAQCMIYNIEPVLNKERANFCEEFQFAARPFLPLNNPDKALEAKQSFDSLFRKK